MTSTNLPMLFSVEEAANILHIGRSTIFKLIRDGELESIRLGRSRRIPVDALEQYINDLRAAKQ